MGGLWAYINYLVATFCDSNKFDMQLNHVLKKLNFDPKVKWVGGGVCGQNICYHVVIVRDTI